MWLRRWRGEEENACPSSIFFLFLCLNSLSLGSVGINYAASRRGGAGDKTRLVRRERERRKRGKSKRDGGGVGG
jgi:hypothetical protein